MTVVIWGLTLVEASLLLSTRAPQEWVLTMCA
jgi:hypothetical protein